MNITALSPEIQEYIDSLIKRNVLKTSSTEDKMLINYLRAQKIDKDYLCIPNSTYRRSLYEAC